MILKPMPYHRHSCTSARPSRHWQTPLVSRQQPHLQKPPLILTHHRLSQHRRSLTINLLQQLPAHSARRIGLEIEKRAPTIHNRQQRSHPQQSLTIDLLHRLPTRSAARRLTRRIENEIFSAMPRQGPARHTPSDHENEDEDEFDGGEIHNMPLGIDSAGLVNLFVGQAAAREILSKEELGADDGEGWMKGWLTSGAREARLIYRQEESAQRNQHDGLYAPVAATAINSHPEPTQPTSTVSSPPAKGDNNAADSDDSISTKMLYNASSSGPKWPVLDWRSPDLSHNVPCPPQQKRSFADVSNNSRFDGKDREKGKEDIAVWPARASNEIEVVGEGENDGSPPAKRARRAENSRQRLKLIRERVRKEKEKINSLPSRQVGIDVAGGRTSDDAAGERTRAEEHAAPVVYIEISDEDEAYGAKAGRSASRPTPVIRETPPLSSFSPLYPPPLLHGPWTSYFNEHSTPQPPPPPPLPISIDARPEAAIEAAGGPINASPPPTHTTTTTATADDNNNNQANPPSPIPPHPDPYLLDNPPTIQQPYHQPPPPSSTQSSNTIRVEPLPLEPIPATYAFTRKETGNEDDEEEEASYIEQVDSDGSDSYHDSEYDSSSEAPRKSPHAAALSPSHAVPGGALTYTATTWREVGEYCFFIEAETEAEAEVKVKVKVRQI
ncbi:MAG: hypothetical protein Q9160_003330 [Pyrenula sp. 1 TL-2023]